MIKYLFGMARQLKRWRMFFELYVCEQIINVYIKTVRKSIAKPKKNIVLISL